jgi:hypothetical protein
MCTRLYAFSKFLTSASPLLHGPEAGDFVALILLYQTFPPNLMVNARKNIQFTLAPILQAIIFSFQTSTMQFTFLHLLSLGNTGETALSYLRFVLTVKFLIQ